jgi:hypothetical protein
VCVVFIRLFHLFLVYPGCIFSFFIEFSYIVLIVWIYYRRAFRDELDVLQLIRHPNVLEIKNCIFIFFSV